MEYRLAGTGGYPNIEVSGEAWREREITTALGRSPRVDEEIEVTVPATLVPEPDNPHDRNAISVRINGEVVGYIGKDETKTYLKDIQRITASGHAPSTAARVWMVRRNHREGGSRFYSRISVALPWNGLSLPQNDPPATTYTLLPWGGGLQVTGEEEHFEQIKPYITGSDVDLVLVTLHRSEKLLKSGQAREVVEVRLDGQRIGELTPTTSRHFLPTIDHTTARGAEVAAYARVKGSQLGAEVVLQGAKATELPDTWLDGPFETLPPLIPKAASYDVPAAYVPQPPRPSAAKPAALRGPGVAATSNAKSGCLGVAAMLVALTAVGGAVVTYLA